MVVAAPVVVEGPLVVGASVVVPAAVLVDVAPDVAPGDVDASDVVLEPLAPLEV